MSEKEGISRRDFLRAAGTVGLSGGLLGAYAGQARGQNGEGHGTHAGRAETGHMNSHGGNSTVGDVNPSRFDRSGFLRDFYWGDERREGGRVVREYELTAEEAEIEVAPGVMYPAWAYNGQVPGPPLRKHIEKGLYGAFVIDPKEGRPEADEMVMVMNGFDTNFDASNEVYAVNTVAFHYQKNPIEIKKGELVRIYVVNVLEFDFINSFHTHANFFNYYPTARASSPRSTPTPRCSPRGSGGSWSSA